MKTLFKISIFYLFFLQSALSNEKIAYLDIDFILSNSNKGMSIIKLLEKTNQDNITKLQEKEKILKKMESDIDKKKNILSEDEINDQILDLKNKIVAFRKEKQKIVSDFNNLKKKEITVLMNLINPIVTDYIKEKSISIVLDKKNILIGQKSYDITKNILEAVNTELK
tara:strand:+ start:1195 stop:1698 length:504 start_codon:yes stop_codon:yes gene_type:complete